MVLYDNSALVRLELRTPFRFQRVVIRHRLIDGNPFEYFSSSTLI